MRQFNIARTLRKPNNQNLGVSPTPAQKIINVANKMGNPNQALQQGTTWHMYDSLPLDGRTTYEFFEGASSRAFPLTNMNKNGGMLGTGEAATLLNAQILFFTWTAAAGVTAITDLTSNLNWQQAEMAFMQGNQQVLKRMKLQTWVDQYNRSSQIPENNVFHFRSLLTIQSFLEFSAIVRLPAGITTANTYAQLIIEGEGGIFAPKATF